MTILAIPETAAGMVLSAWLAAFNSAEPARMRAFDETHRGTPPLEQMLGFRELTGDFALVRIEKSEPYSLIAQLQENDSDTVGKHLSDYPNKHVASKVTLRHLLTDTVDSTCERSRHKGSIR